MPQSGSKLPLVNAIVAGMVAVFFTFPARAQVESRVGGQIGLPPNNFTLEYEASFQGHLTAASFGYLPGVRQESAVWITPRLGLTDQIRLGLMAGLYQAHSLDTASANFLSYPVGIHLEYLNSWLRVRVTPNAPIDVLAKARSIQGLLQAQVYDPGPGLAEADWRISKMLEIGVRTGSTPLQLHIIF